MTLVDAISAVVEDVRAAWNDATGEQPYFDYGHPREIFNTLSEKDQSETFKYSKYPLIALILSPEVENVNGVETYKDVRVVIMTETSPDYKAESRFDNTFTPVLTPLRKLFIKKLKYSRLVTSEDNYSNNWQDKPYWGNEDGLNTSELIGNDALDAVVITGLNIGLVECRNINEYVVTEDGFSIITEG